MPANYDSFAIDAPPEVFFSSAHTSRVVTYAVQTGRVRRIARGVYTRNAERGRQRCDPTDHTSVRHRIPVVHSVSHPCRRSFPELP